MIEAEGKFEHNQRCGGSKITPASQP